MVKLNEKVKAHLEKPILGILATIGKDGLPQQTAVWYELEGDRIVMNTQAGRIKHLNLVRDPRASLCVVSAYPYVTVSGKVTLDEDQEAAQAVIARLAVRYVGEEESKAYIRRFLTEGRVSLYLNIEHVITNIGD